MLTRRRFLAASAAVAAAPLARAADAKPARILLRSSWQTVNIGDIAHTPGVLALLEKHYPEAEVILWASGDLSQPVAAMEHKRFPKLKIVKGSLGADGKASNPDLAAAVEWADFFLHGSGPGLVGLKDMTAFAKHTKKPYGVFGITYGGSDAATQEFLGGAKFFFFRDTVSLAKAKAEKIACPVMEFGPDGAFAVDLRDDDSAAAFLKANGLEDGKFLCCIPRWRNTPYWTIRKNTPLDPRKLAENEKWKEHDHAQLRAAIEAIVKETELKVLVCPEDMTQMAAGKELIVDKLPDAVRKRVVWRENYWLTDEALSTYVRSAGLFGNEMHSPIMCVGNGIPAIVCRWAQQTSKGFMWRDIGLGEWLFDLDTEADVPKVAPAVLALAKDPAAAKAKVAPARELVAKRQRAMVEALKAAVRA
jgi:polysaccharide pyruvyl transferase WcaK-like protein